MSEQGYKGEYIVLGPPGTGKTTWLARQIEAIVERFSGPFMQRLHPNPVLVCSLTRAAASEVAGRNTPIKRKMIGTLHSFCYRSLGGPEFITAEHIELWNSRHPTMYVPPSAAGDPDTISDTRDDGAGGGRRDDDYSAIDIARHRMIPIERMRPGLATFREAWEQFKIDNGPDGKRLHDFTDLIEQAGELTDTAPGNPAVIMVDEAQDLSALEYRVIKRWASNADALFIVGDPWQALYVWRGADPSLFDDPSVPAERRKLLGQSYRVPRKVLHLSMEWMNQTLSNFEAIDYKPRKQARYDDDPVDGEIDTIRSPITDPEETIEYALNQVDRGRTVMIQASCSYMLRQLIEEMKRRRIPFAQPWRKHRRDWNPIDPTSGTAMRLARFLQPLREPEPIGWSVGDVAAFSKNMIVKDNMVHGAKKALEGDAEADPNRRIVADELANWFLNDTPRMVLEGRVDAGDAAQWWAAVQLKAAQSTANYAAGVVKAWGEPAIRETPRIYVGTIHSFKGAEADVAIVSPDLSQSGFREYRCGGERRDSIARLFYVAATRAIERLVIIRNASNTCVPLMRLAETLMLETAR